MSKIPRRPGPTLQPPLELPAGTSVVLTPMVRTLVHTEDGWVERAEVPQSRFPVPLPPLPFAELKAELTQGPSGVFSLLERIASLERPGEVEQWREWLRREERAPQENGSLFVVPEAFAPRHPWETRGRLYSLLHRAPPLVPEVKDALTRALDLKAAELEKGAPPLESVTRISPRTFKELIEIRQRDVRGIPRFDSRFDDFYTRLPDPLKRWVDGVAQRTPLWLPFLGDGGATYRGVPVVEVMDVPRIDFNRAHTLGVVLTEEAQGRWREPASVAETEAPPPSFLPRAVQRASVLELAKGVALRSSFTVDDVLAGLFMPSPHLPHRSPLSEVWVERMNALPPQEREEAAPWIVLEYLARGGDITAPVRSELKIDDVRQLSSHDVPFESFYIEAAPDEREEANTLRTLFRGPLENEAIRQMRTYAPALLETLEPEPMAPIPAVETMLGLMGPNVAAGVNFGAIQHLTDDNVETLKLLRRMGLDPANTHVMDVPYSTDERNALSLEESGVNVYTGTHREHAYSLWREVQACDLVRKLLADHAENGKPIVVWDDGGYVTSALAKRFPEFAPVFTIVEQTTRGITVAEQVGLPTDVIAVAKARIKRLELPGVQRGIVDVVKKRLEPFFRDGNFLPGRPAVVIGYGPIGQVVAEAFRSMNREVVVVDSSEDARKLAQDAGFGTAEKAEDVLEQSAVVVGCTGRRSLSKEQLSLLREGQVVISCSSSDVEFELPPGTFFHEDVFVSGENHAYLLLGGGFPINFTGEGDINTAEELQYTRAAMVAALAQACELATKPRRGPPKLHPLDQRWENLLLGMAASAGDSSSAEER